MFEEPVNILLVDDDEDDYFITRSMLEHIHDTRYHLEWSSTYDQAFEQMTSNHYDVYLVDYRLGADSGLDLLKEALNNGCTSPIILLTGQGDREIDLAAMRAGASDYLVKGIIQAPLLERSIRYAIERKRSEEALKESEERYRDLFENANDMILSVDMDGKFNYVNKAWRNVLGYGDEDTRRLTIFDVIHEDSLESFKNIFQRCQNGESINLVELAFITKDNRNVYAQGSVNCKIVDGVVVSTRAIFRDVTQRKRAVQERNRLFETSRDLIAIFDYRGYFRDLNASWERTFGYSYEELKKIYILDIIHPDDRKIAIESVQKIKKDHSNLIFELRMVCKDHSIKWLSWSIAVEEKDKLIYSYARDVTEIKKSRLALRESEKRYRELIENSQGLIFTHDLNGQILTINQAFADTLGYDHREIIGKTLHEFIKDENLADYEDYITDISQKPLSIGSLKLKKADGKIITVAYRNFRFKPQGKSEYVIGNAQDITDRVKAEEALLREQQQLKRVIENAPVPMALFDSNLNFITHSQRWMQEFPPRTIDPIIGKPYTEMYPWLPDSWIEICSRGLKGEILSKSEDALSMLNGRKVHFRWAIHPWRDDKGNIQGIILVADRIDDLVNARLEAQRASNAKSAFLANITHELRTPLNAILGFSQILSKDTLLTSSQQEYVENMFRSGMHLLNMINDILDLSKIEAGKLDLNNEIVNLHDLLDEINGLFTLKSREKGLNWTVAKGDHIPVFIETDPAKLRQILINLVGNAIKFTDRGYVELSVDQIKNESDDKSTVLLFSVKDTGRGIPEQQIQEIFEPFRQVKGRISEGTGLGLSITQRLVKLMNGTLTVSSVIDSGTEFKVTIPFIVRSAPQNDLQNQFKHVTGIRGDHKWKVLIVDDVDYNRSVLSVMLSRIGFECINTAEGYRGIELAEIMQPDIIFMDISLSDIDGLTATHKIRKNSHNKNLAIIAMTASRLTEIKQRFEENDFTDFIRKPFTEAEIFETIHKNLKIDYTFERFNDLEKLNGTFSTKDAATFVKALPEDLREEFKEALEFQDLEQIENLSNLFPKYDQGEEMVASLKNAVLKSDFYYITMLNKALEDNI